MYKNFGWLPDLPDFRDYDIYHPKVTEIMKKGTVSTSGLTSDEKLPDKVDLREYFSPIEDQKNLGSCTSMAGVALIEYYERRAFGNHVDGSKLFLYKVTRNLLGLKGDTGAHIRSTMGAMVLFGIPPEKYWPYDIDAFDKEPPSFVYSLAQNYKADLYFRLDCVLDRKVVLDCIKFFLSHGFPSMFGFVVYDSIIQATETGKIPFPEKTDKIRGGHALAAAGYDDSMVIQNDNGGYTTKGAFLIRNSWGKEWGEEGWGWLPYEYLLRGLAIDWWTVLSAKYVETNKFGIKS